MSHTSAPAAPLPPLKRSKAQACASCRKMKARCEVLDTSTATRRCHRCVSIKAQCSFEIVERAQPREQADPDARLLMCSILAEGVPMKSSGSGSEGLLDNMSAMSAKIASANLPDMSGLSRPYLWAFIPQHMNWSAPMSAMQELAKAPEIGSAPFPNVHDESLAHILARHEVDHLLSVFDTYFTPWLNFTLTRTNPNPSAYSFLDTACCTIASRYLDASSRYLVAPRLQSLLTDQISALVFDQSGLQTLEVIQGLIIVGLWAPICGGGCKSQGDGKVLVAMAATMALSIHLDESAEKALTMRMMAVGGLVPMDVMVYDEMLNRARIWITLTTTESMLCLGSGRVPVSKRSQSDTDLFPVTTPETIQEGRDFRIRLLAELFSATQEGLDVKLLRREEIDNWYLSISSALAALERLSRWVKPLSVITTHEKFHYHILHTIILICRQQLLYHAILSARRLVADQYALNNELASQLWTWTVEIRPRGLDVIPQWGKESVHNAESVLTSFLQSDTATLSTSPDVVFTMAAFASSLTIAAKFFMIQRMRQAKMHGIGILLNGMRLSGPMANGSGLGDKYEGDPQTGIIGWGDILLEQMVIKLAGASLAEGHAPGRYSTVVKGMLASWKRADKATSPSLGPPQPVTPNPIADSQSNAFSGTQAEPAVSNWGNASGTTSSTGSPGHGSGGSDSSGSDDFWSDFLQDNSYSTFGPNLSAF